MRRCDLFAADVEHLVVIADSGCAAQGQRDRLWLRERDADRLDSDRDRSTLGDLSSFGHDGEHGDIVVGNVHRRGIVGIGEVGGRICYAA